MPPISNEIKGHMIAFVRPAVRLSVRPFVTLFCACHIIRTLHARVFKFYICVPHEKIADLYFFLVWYVFFFFFFFFFSFAPLKKSELSLVSKYFNWVLEI